MPVPDPLVSIIVNVFNGAAYLVECLESILGLEGAIPVEVLVVDDGSTDATRDLLRSYRRPPFQIVRIDPNGGAAAAITHATSLIRGEFTARIDFDDRYRPGFLAASLAALKSCPDAAFVCASVQSIDADGNAGDRFSPGAHGQEPGCRDRFREMLTSHFVTAPTLLARTEHWRRAMPIPEGMDFCDWYINLTMAESAPVVVLDQLTADYRVHPAGMHLTKVATGMGERVTQDVLDRFLVRGARSREVAPFARKIRAGHAKDWGDKYFAAHMHADAMRCYRQALRLRPSLCKDAGMIRRMTGMWLGRERYDALKARFGQPR